MIFRTMYVIMLSVITLSVAILNVVILSVVRLNVVMLSVKGPFSGALLWDRHLALPANIRPRRKQSSLFADKE
jgi:hypothetical protein